MHLTQQLPNGSSTATTTRVEARVPTVYVLLRDEYVRGNLPVALRGAGYSVRHFVSLDALAVASRGVEPDVVIAGLDQIGETDETRAVWGKLMANFVSAASIMVSPVDSFAERLRAVQLGSRAFVPAGEEVETIVDLLLQMMPMVADDRPRVLLVDDDYDYAVIVRRVLGRLGIDVRVEQDPYQALATATDFDPAVVLMDIGLPNANGIQIAEAIIQTGAFNLTRFIFLTGGVDDDTKQKAVQTGGAVFLDKSMGIQQLRAVVRGQLDRARQLRKMTSIDGLTAVLNASSVRSYGGLELQRTIRKGGSLSIAIFDIDHFKQVNDKWGHPIGDRVLRAFARLLSRGIRAGDLVGRLGGEEFMVVFPDQDAVAAGKIVERIREDTSRILFEAGAETFSITVSCGIAQFADGEDWQNLESRADSALYDAKNTGRNRVCVAPG